MKIRGKTKFEAPRKTVRLARTVSGPSGEEKYEEVTIRVRALPVGSERAMFSLFPEPVAPQDYAKDGRGIVLRDPDTKKPILQPMVTPEFLAAQDKAMQGRMGYLLFNGIDDPEVQFSVQGEQNKPDFYYQVFAEVVDFGLTMGDIGHLVSEITGLMNLSQDIEDAKGN